MKALDIVIDEKDGALWAAALNENRRLFALECDTPGEEIRWGSIYLGKIETIDKKLDACWVNLGEGLMGLMPRKEWPDPNKSPEAGSNLIVQAKTGIFKSTDETSRNGDELNVSRKVRQEPKVTRLSSDVTLPGRYVIFAPHEKENRLSRRIRDRKARRHMMHMLDELEELLNGCILRAAAQNIQTDILVREGHILQHNWELLQDRAAMLSEPQELMRGPNAIERILSDMAGCQIENIDIAIMDHMSKVEEWSETFAPDLITKITPVEVENATDDFALFDHYDLAEQIEELLQPYVLLSDGGNLIIQDTAALLAVDVNRGGDQTGSNLDLNLQAAREVGRQLRLRNLGGIVMVDFLKAKTKSDEGRIIAAMEEAVAQDACTVQIHGMTALGLMEITRQRRLPTLRDRVLGRI